MLKLTDMKHTKGKWKNTGVTSQMSNHRDILANNKRIILLEDYTRNEEEAEANAKLIAAAPELLEALIQLNEGFKREWGVKGNSERVSGNIDYWNKLASTAIKKATQ